MESGQIFVVVVAALITGSITLSAFAQAWATSRKHRGSDNLPRLDVIEARLARMEEAIETVAVEMERLAEGQRFTAKLLTDRIPTSQAVGVRAQHNDRQHPTPI